MAQPRSGAAAGPGTFERKLRASDFAGYFSSDCERALWLRSGAALGRDDDARLAKLNKLQRERDTIADGQAHRARQAVRARRVRPPG
jgi:hypothetical protein